MTADDQSQKGATPQWQRSLHRVARDLRWDRTRQLSSDGSFGICAHADGQENDISVEALHDVVVLLSHQQRPAATSLQLLSRFLATNYAPVGCVARIGPAVTVNTHKVAQRGAHIRSPLRVQVKGQWPQLLVAITLTQFVPTPRKRPQVLYALIIRVVLVIAFPCVAARVIDQLLSLAVVVEATELALGLRVNAEVCKPPRDPGSLAGWLRRTNTYCRLHPTQSCPIARSAQSSGRNP